MKVFIKDLTCTLEIKNKPMEIDVANTKGTHVGDLYVGKTGLTWCSGKTDRKNGVHVSWEAFIKAMEESKS
jgi:hypothetical protein